jgi:transaldolase
VEDLSVTGLTSNPTLFDHAIKNSTAYDAAIRQKLKEGKSGEGLFFELALEDLTLAAQFQDEGAKSFVKSGNELMAVIASKSAGLANASQGVRHERAGC